MWIKTLKNYRNIVCLAFAKQQTYFLDFKTKFGKKNMF